MLYLEGRITLNAVRSRTGHVSPDLELMFQQQKNGENVM